MVTIGTVCLIVGLIGFLEWVNRPHPPGVVREEIVSALVFFGLLGGLYLGGWILILFLAGNAHR